MYVSGIDISYSKPLRKVIKSGSICEEEDKQRHKNWKCCLIPSTQVLLSNGWTHRTGTHDSTEVLQEAPDTMDSFY